MNNRRALLSVWDKTGIVDFGRALADGEWEVLSTGGTARALREAGVPVTDVSAVTGHPEMMDGRVKTLHPAVHAGLLARRDGPGDMEALAAQGYGPIDLVAVNLYPFRETVADPDVTLGVAMENVDIGGPTMIRAAAKNHRDVWVVVDPRDYGAVLEAVTGEGQGGLEGQKEDSEALR
ncbi:MAG: bifunctional phosphoribosylaminoimidazolecarboxamide formyltransferase/IMP cyclohydrolase, partial [Gemmatimonadetes bacterium]|nr:bifunctional phosphoribosylaminoimidazolecarboxamide formyltransferase/IMP cyclohydrolase [Gemmatimonadota bacterium]